MSFVVPTAREIGVTLKFGETAERAEETGMSNLGLTKCRYFCFFPRSIADKSISASAPALAETELESEMLAELDSAFVTARTSLLPIV